MVSKLVNEGLIREKAFDIYIYEQIYFKNPKTFKKYKIKKNHKILKYGFFKIFEF